MCNQKVGVVKRIDIEKISKEIAALAKGLDSEVKVDVGEVKRIQAELDRALADKP